MLFDKSAVAHAHAEKIHVTFKYLGVLFDNFMTWKAHADYVCKKVASSSFSILGRVRSFVTKEAATVGHNAVMLPLFGYCDIAWSKTLQQDIDRLRCLQNRSARIITRCSRSSEAADAVTTRLNSFFSVFTH